MHFLDKKLLLLVFAIFFIVGMSSNGKAQSKIVDVNGPDYNAQKNYTGTFSITLEELYNNGRTGSIKDGQIELNSNVRGVQLKLNNLKWDAEISSSDRAKLKIYFGKTDILLRRNGSTVEKNSKAIILGEGELTKKVDFDISAPGDYTLNIYYDVKLPTQGYDNLKSSDSEKIKFYVVKPEEEVIAENKPSEQEESIDVITYDPEEKTNESSGGKPQTTKREESREKIVDPPQQVEDSEAKRAWDKIVQRGNYRVQELQDFINTYNEIQYVNIAKERLQEREQVIWSYCKYGDSAQCVRYQRYFPNGKYRSEVKDKLAALEARAVAEVTEEEPVIQDTMQNTPEEVVREPEKEQLAGLVSPIGVNYELKIYGGSPPFQVYFVDVNKDKKIEGETLESDSTILRFKDLPKRLNGEYRVEVDCANANPGILEGVIKVEREGSDMWIVLTVLTILVVGGGLAYYLLWYKKMKERKINFDDY